MDTDMDTDTATEADTGADVEAGVETETENEVSDVVIDYKKGMYLYYSLLICSKSNCLGIGAVYKLRHPKFGNL